MATAGPALDSNREQRRAQIEALRRKLLDLTRRNRLLNFQYSPRTSLRFIEGDLAHTYRQLSGGCDNPKVPMAGLPEPSRQNWISRNGKDERPAPEDWAQERGISTGFDLPKASSGSLRALMYNDVLASHCRRLERANELEMAEKGTNPLHLVLGFLRYPESPGADTSSLAPLVCLPVRLVAEVGRGRTSYYLKSAADEPADNISLREKLEQDLDLVLPAFDPEAAEPLETFLSAASRLLRQRPGFTLLRHASLCMLGFSGIEMYRDLDPAYWPELADVPLICRLFGSKTSRDRSVEGEMEIESAPASDLPLVCDADSSQHAALAQVLCSDRSMVIEGPPGTGKSQTIANLIAGCLSDGKSVLFVAEKMVALKVVADRLRQAGLEPFLLPMHSENANRSAVLAQIKQRLAFRARSAAEIQPELARAERRRKEIALFAENLNRIQFNQLGLTLHQVIWRLEMHRARLGGRDEALSQLQIALPDAITHEGLDIAEECLSDLALDFSRFGAFGPGRTFWGFTPNLRATLESDAVALALSSALPWAEKMAAAAAEWQTMLGEEPAVLDRDCAASYLGEIARLEPNLAAGLPLHLLAECAPPDSSFLRSLATLEDAILRCRGLDQTIVGGLRPGARPGAEAIESLLVLRAEASCLGLTLGTPAEIRTWLASSSAALRTLSAAADWLRVAASALGWDPCRLAGGIDMARELVRLGEDIPADMMRPQTAAFSEDGAENEIQGLARLADRIRSLRSNLEGRVFFDLVPAGPELARVAAALGRHRGPLRWLRSEYRKATRHIAPVWRARFSAPARHDLVIKLAELARSQEAWRESKAVRKYFPGNAFPSEEDVDVRVRLAHWNAEFEGLRRRAGIEVPLLSRDHVCQLVARLAVLQEPVAAVTSAWIDIQTCAPSLSAASSLAANADRVSSMIAAVAKQLPWMESVAAPGATLDGVVAAGRAGLARAELEAVIADLPLGILGSENRGLETDVAGIREVLAIGRGLGEAALPQPIKNALRLQPAVSAVAVRHILVDFMAGLDGLRGFQATMSEYGDFRADQWAGADSTQSAQFAAGLRDRMVRACGAIDQLTPWHDRTRKQEVAENLRLGKLVAALEATCVPAELWKDAYRLLVFRSICRTALGQLPEVTALDGDRHNRAIKEFRRADRECIRLRGAAVAAAASARCRTVPGQAGSRVQELTEMCLIDHLLPQTRPRVSIRALFHRSWESVRALKPCLMMNPTAVARLLAPGHTFDVVVMDEASQLTPEVALGAIGRGRQLVVVGDSKQLPPTNFFRRAGSDEDEEDEFTATHAESILDVCAARLPSCSLRWHYRSRHESLIAFSNHHFYGGGLILFPAPYSEGNGLGLRTVYLPDAVYLDQRNMIEAHRVVDLAIEHIRRWPEQSVGIVTLNRAQCDVVDEIWRQLLQTDEAAAEWEATQTKLGHSMFVRNLENVQGDERDAIFISTTFGKPPGAAVVRQNFGPISREDGWRRLNVLFTRARLSMTMVTSLTSADILVGDGVPQGTRVFRDFLAYAQSGVLESAEETGREPESDFERVVMDRLQILGYETTPQLGVAGYRIDIAVRHPDVPGVYLAAVECDGASYHSGRTTRDRDRIRQEILEAMGWRGRIWRIWSTDWFRNPEVAMLRLTEFLDHLRKTWQPEMLPVERWRQENVQHAEAVLSPATFPHSDRSVQPGDTVHYAKTSSPEQPITVQISDIRSDPANGVIGIGAPLAQALLDAVVGDEVSLQIPGQSPQLLRVLKIIRPSTSAPHPERKPP